jgi:hypothetical protein
MRRSRIKSDANVSFFAFQDIITSVSGILILIVLMMVLMLRTPAAVEVPVEPSETRSLEELAKLIEAAIDKIKELAASDLETGDETIPELEAGIARLEKELDQEGDPLRRALLRDVEAAASELAGIREKLAATEAAREEARAELAKVKAAVDARAEFLQDNQDASQVWLRFNPTEKFPIILELSGTGAVLRDIRKADFRENIAAAALPGRVRELAGRHDRGSAYFVFFIRPSGIEHVSNLREVLSEEGFSLGYRPLAEGAVVKIFTEETLEFGQP